LSKEQITGQKDPCLPRLAIRQQIEVGFPADAGGFQVVLIGLLTVM
jgi:hypothetical protein